MKYSDIIRMVEPDGWQLVRTTGSHMRDRHATKPSTVTLSAGG